MSGNRASNDGDLVRRWCVAGQGLAVKSCLDMSADLLSGRVVNVMSGFKPRSTELWLICPSRQSITPAVRLLRDMFREKSRGILSQLVEEGILDDSALAQRDWSVSSAKLSLYGQTHRPACIMTRMEYDPRRFVRHGRGTQGQISLINDHPGEDLRA
jgi:hypothetical protein